MPSWRNGFQPLLVALSLLLGTPAIARAQVQGCQPSQYVDRSSPSAVRALTWDFSILSAPERCMQVRAGQTVVWNGDLEHHPLAEQGGDTPNPIANHQNGAVTFTTPGTFGYFCTAHTSMKGAIKVVPAPAVQAAAAPALPLGPAAMLAALLLVVGLVRHAMMSATRTQDQ